MAKKYYAVVKGRTPGIYFTWEDCRKQIHEYPGAEFKGFSTIEEAEQFIETRTASDTVSGNRDKMDKGVELTERENDDSYPVSTDTHLIAYVDGSYDHSQLRYAYGCVLVLPEEVISLNGSVADEEYLYIRYVAVEILGS